MYRAKEPLPLGTQSSEPETFAHQNTNLPFTLGQLLQQKQKQKQQNRQKQLVAVLKVVGHVMQTPLDQWAGGKDF